MTYNYNGKKYDLNYNIEKNKEFDIWLQNPENDADTVELFELPTVEQECVEDMVFKAAVRKGI